MITKTDVSKLVTIKFILTFLFLASTQNTQGYNIILILNATVQLHSLYQNCLLLHYKNKQKFDQQYKILIHRELSCNSIQIYPPLFSPHFVAFSASCAFAVSSLELTSSHETSLSTKTEMQSGRRFCTRSKYVTHQS